MLDENIKWANTDEIPTSFRSYYIFRKPKTQTLKIAYIVILKVFVCGLQNLIINLAILYYAETKPPLKYEQWKLELRCPLSQQMAFLIHFANFDD